jgi:hypothetical protein
LRDSCSWDSPRASLVSLSTNFMQSPSLSPRLYPNTGTNNTGSISTCCDIIGTVFNQPSQELPSCPI